MMGRTRARSRVGWPDNLYPCKGGFKYRHPVTRKESWMGMDWAKAKAAAKTLNDMLSPANSLVAKVTGDKTVADALKVFRADDMPNRGWGEKTAAWYEVYLGRIAKDIGTRDLAGLTVKDCAEYIRSVTSSARSRQTYRLVLGWILACAVEEGWIDTNPALQTRKHAHRRKRERLTLEAYKAIHAQAPAWLQNAMDLSLITLLRFEDVAMARFADVRDGKLYVIPQKTEDTTLVKLRIDVTEPLAALVARCRDKVVSPYVVHRLPERPQPTERRAKARQQHTQVLPVDITRAFATARDAAGIDSDSPPTFHEIRSLGGALLRDAGWTKAQVQELMGHASEAMTQHYLEGHDAPWTDVRPGLSLPA